MISQRLRASVPWQPTRRLFTTLLAVTTIAVYTLIATGAALSSTAISNCSNWLLCFSGSESLLSLGVLVTVGHRLLTGLVGLLLAGTLLASVMIDLDWRARTALLGAGILFPVQIGIGGLVVLTEIAYVGELHLVIAAAVFMLVLTALGWTLEGTPTTQPNQPIEIPDAGADTSDTVSTSSAESGESHDSGSGSRARAYLELTKPRLMWLLCLLALAGIALATTTGEWPSGVTVAGTLAGGILAIGASGTFNHLFERDRDQQMERTADRPVATDQIPIRNAAVFGVGLALLSIGIMLTAVNTLAAALTVIAIFYYSVIYTVVLKPNTSWNIAIGGGAGALPALIGWVAVTESIGLGGVLLAALVVIWTPAHFYNLAIVYRDDYARAGYPMFPVVAGVAAARRRILFTLGGTLLVTASLVVATPLSWLFATVAVVAGSVFLGSVVSQCRRRTPEATLQSFHASNAYLGLVLLAIVVETTLILP